MDRVVDLLGAFADGGWMVVNGWCVLLFEMEFSQSIVIPSSKGIHLPFNLFTPDIQSNAEATLAIHDTRKEYVEEVRLVHLEVTIDIPGNADFSFLESVEVYLSAENLDEVMVAWKEHIPAETGRYLELEVSGVNLHEYILKDEFKLRINAITDELLTSDHHLEIKSVFMVDAEILGQ